MLKSRRVLDDERDAVDDVEDRRVAGVVGRLDRDEVRLRRDAEVAAAERIALRARLSELPAMMPATCVPWPKPSPAVVAPGDVTTFATMRDWPLKSLKSGMSPAMPVSMTATPTPRPVMPRCQSLSARVVFGYDVASWSAVRPVLWTRELSVRPTTLLVARRGRLACLAGSLTARPWMNGTRLVTLPPWARDEDLGLALRERRLELDDRGDLAGRGLLGHRREARLRRRGRLGHRPADGERHDRRHEGDGSARYASGTSGKWTTSGHLRVLSSKSASKLAAELSHVRARPLALRPRLTTGLPCFSPVDPVIGR